MNEWIAILIGFALGAIALLPLIVLWFYACALDAQKIARAGQVKPK